MRIAERIVSGLERRDSLENPSTDLVQALIGLDAMSSATGIAVTPERALSVAAFFTGVRILAEDTASLPLQAFKRVERGRTELRDDPRWELLNGEPNPKQDAFELRELMVANAILFDKSFTYIGREAGAPSSLWSIPPQNVRPAKELIGDGEGWAVLVNGSWQPVPETDLIIIRSFLGKPLVKLARQTLGLSLASEEFAARMFSNGGRPGGMIIPKDDLDEEQIRDFKRKWEAGHQGLTKSHLIGILPNADYKEIGFDPEKLQMLDSRKFQVQEIARWLRLPAYKLEADRGGSMTYSNLTSQQTDYVVSALRNWLVRIERELNRKLFLPSEHADGLYVEHVVDALLRGDVEARYRVYSIGREWGWLSVNDILELENRPGIGEDGDIYLQRVTYVPAGTPVAMYPKLSDLGSGEAVTGVTGGTEVNGSALERYEHVERMLAELVEERR